ncbi:hypothetical protein DPMN_110349 [Dreissena polymorpha]|uniref:Uncharacterized protein n=1 Tax=Dreissena polymorpha TaxID=45954 RepID=A0A9D4KCE7_DREPO|nr:hypothetical protein DPMN_110349 [Dreissena polymorpha]
MSACARTGHVTRNVCLCEDPICNSDFRPEDPICNSKCLHENPICYAECLPKDPICNQNVCLIDFRLGEASQTSYDDHHFHMRLVGNKLWPTRQNAFPVGY